MPIFPNTETARAAAFQTIRENALDGLSNPGVTARLGEVAAELLNEAEDMFYVRRKGDMVVLPQEEVGRDNIGLHPILRRDMSMPDVQAFALRLGRHSLDDLEHIDPTAARASEVIGVKPFYPYGKSLRAIGNQMLFNLSTPVHNIAVTAPDRNTFAATSRPLLGSHKLEKASPAHAAALLGAFIERLILHEDLVASMQSRLPHARPDDQIAAWQYRTTIERSAYYVEGHILEANKVKPTATLDDAKGIIRDLGAQQAGEALMSHIIQEESGKPPMPRYIAAAAISHKYGTPDITAYADPEEAIAYNYADLLN